MIKRIKKSAWTAKQFRSMGANAFQTTCEFVRLMVDDRYFDEWYNDLSEMTVPSHSEVDHGIHGGNARRSSADHMGYDQVERMPR